MLQTTFYKRRKCKVLFLTEEDVLNATMSFLRSYDIRNSMTWIPGKRIKRSIEFKDGFVMPDKVEVLACRPDIERCGFRFLLYHESFEEVPAREVYPEIKYVTKREYVLNEEQSYKKASYTDRKEITTDITGTLLDILNKFQEKHKLSSIIAESLRISCELLYKYNDATLSRARIVELLCSAVERCEYFLLDEVGIDTKDSMIRGMLSSQFSIAKRIEAIHNYLRRREKFSSQVKRETTSERNYSSIDDILVEFQKGKE